ncbi:hypothetical protein FKM82_028372 [Ascaphus truei]
MEQSFQALSGILSLPPRGDVEREADQKAELLGQALDNWTDLSVGRFWSIGGVCTAGSLSSCPSLPTCSKTHWSSLSPDPKSELGPVRPDGRRR